jgi:hypothetical protein
MKMTPMKKRAEKEGGKKKEMITRENIKRLWRSRLRRRKRRKHPSLQMRLGSRQKQVSLDRCLIKKSQQIAVIPLVTMKVVLPNN